MVEFKFAQYGTDFGTREMGQRLRQMIRPLLNGEEVVVLDFREMNDMAEHSVLVALQRRYRVIKEGKVAGK